MIDNLINRLKKEGKLAPCVAHYGVKSFSPHAKYDAFSKQQYLESYGLKSATDPDYDKAKAAALETEYDKVRSAFCSYRLGEIQKRNA